MYILFGFSLSLIKKIVTNNWTSSQILKEVALQHELNEVTQQNRLLAQKVNKLEQDNKAVLRDEGTDASSTIKNLKELLDNREISKEEREVTRKVWKLSKLPRLYNDYKSAFTPKNGVVWSGFLRVQWRIRIMADYCAPDR